MIKRIVKAFSLALFAALLICCATMPSKPSSPDDCLVVIKSDFIVNLEMPQASQDARYYVMKLSGDYKPVRVQPVYSTAVVREPAVMVTSIYSQVQANGFSGNPFEYTVKNVILPYKPGSLVIADFVFVKESKKVSESGRFITHTSFRKITDQEREELLAQLRNDPDLVSWSK